MSLGVQHTRQTPKRSVPRADKPRVEEVEAPSRRAIERWENEGGRVPEGDARVNGPKPRAE